MENPTPTKLQRIRFLTKCQSIVDDFVKTEKNGGIEPDLILNIIDHKTRWGKGELEYTVDIKKLEMTFKVV